MMEEYTNRNLPAASSLASVLDTRHSRRRVLQLAGVTALAGMATSLLAACGDDDDDEPAATATTAGPVATATTGQAAQPTATAATTGEAQEGGELIVGMNADP